MIEELTSQVVMATMLLILVVAPALTLVLSLLLLWRYRKAVHRAMKRASGYAPVDTPERLTNRIGETRPFPLAQDAGHSDATLLSCAIRRPWLNATRYVAAGLAFALVFASTAQIVFPSGLGLPGFLIALWLYLWPVFLALPLIVPLKKRHWVAGFLAYVVMYALLSAWASTIHNIPAYHVGEIVVPSRSNVTPETMARLWLIVNAAPTVLMLLCLNRWIRAVVPLVLALVTAAVVGLLATYLAVFSPRGADTAIALAIMLDVPIYWLLRAIALLSLLVFVWLGWGLIRWIAHRYQHGRVSDQSLLLDALWLLFASTYSLWLVGGGLLWLASAPLAFVAYKLTWYVAAGFTQDRTLHPVGLTFLRVFSLGRRTETLLEKVAQPWRYVGGIQLITGPDLARSTVQPHQFLDFLAGKLHQQFVSDHASLERAIAARDTAPDPDGRFRINNFFCHADSWQAVLPRLVEEGDLVLMDLRNFSADNAGCVHEIRHLVAEVPYSRCVLLVDETTNASFLDETLHHALAGLSKESPNHGVPVTAWRRFHLAPNPDATDALIRQLCLSASC
ncbi:hypothetical protein GCM10007160_37880 [Litchfieldella qijiaojingensis]|uniref:DUF2868 domain-containing protein n=1 Tax=Litchfieldella qijiaojingensis TaxID=980347 RepID=A0ABQ2Z8J2_9GAMM|nr:hypothetical protein [Halomonas qijiaojingensis]GGY06876.1 hypothetical protein GCM10007160_37880 [Halomonas qijiaojingensis]